MPGSNYKLNTCTQCASEFKSPLARRYCSKKCKSKSESDKRIYSVEEKARRAAYSKDKRSKQTPEQRAIDAAYWKEYGSLNKQAITAYRSGHYATNAEDIKKKQNEKYANDPDAQLRARARAKAWRISNPIRKAEANKRWAENNAQKSLESSKISKAKRRLNPCHRVQASIGAQIRNAIKSKKQGRRWESMLGYTCTDLATHLEMQFVRGMTWDNYGSAWHIDHIVPQAAFEMDEIDDASIIACWSMSNLRPLWAIENLSKRDKRIFLV